MSLPMPATEAASVAADSLPEPTAQRPILLLLGEKHDSPMVWDLLALSIDVLIAHGFKGFALEKDAKENPFAAKIIDLFQHQLIAQTNEKEKIIAYLESKKPPIHLPENWGEIAFSTLQEYVREYYISQGGAPLEERVVQNTFAHCCTAARASALCAIKSLADNGFIVAGVDDLQAMRQAHYATEKQLNSLVISPALFEPRNDAMAHHLKALAAQCQGHVVYPVGSLHTPGLAQRLSKHFRVVHIDTVSTKAHLPKEKRLDFLRRLLQASLEAMSLDPSPKDPGLAPPNTFLPQYKSDPTCAQMPKDKGMLIFETTEHSKPVAKL